MQITAEVRDRKAALGSGVPTRSMDSGGDPTNSALGRAHKIRKRYDEVINKELAKKKKELLQNLNKY